jgi:hypothetical protein
MKTQRPGFKYRLWWCCVALEIDSIIKAPTFSFLIYDTSKIDTLHEIRQINEIADQHKGYFKFLDFFHIFILYLDSYFVVIVERWVSESGEILEGGTVKLSHCLGEMKEIALYY